MHFTNKQIFWSEAEIINHIYITFYKKDKLIKNIYYIQHIWYMKNSTYYNVLPNFFSITAKFIVYSTTYNCIYPWQWWSVGSSSDYELTGYSIPHPDRQAIECLLWIQSSAVITLFNIMSYSMQYCSGPRIIQVIVRTHKRHPIARPHGRKLWGVYCKDFWENSQSYNSTALYYGGKRLVRSFNYMIYNTLSKHC